MKREDDEQLWDVLGHLQAPRLSPFFSRNIVRGLRSVSREPRWIRGWIRWLVPASAIAAAVIAAVIGLHHPARGPKQTADVDIVANIDPQDYEVVADLDQLLASDENSLWDDNQTL